MQKNTGKVPLYPYHARPVHLEKRKKSGMFLRLFLFALCWFMACAAVDAGEVMSPLFFALAAGIYLAQVMYILLEE